MHRAPTEYRLTKAIQGACTLQWLLNILNAQHGCSHDPSPKLIKRSRLASTMAISGSQICQSALLERSDWPKKDPSEGRVNSCSNVLVPFRSHSRYMWHALHHVRLMCVLSHPTRFERSTAGASAIHCQHQSCLLGFGTNRAQEPSTSIQKLPMWCACSTEMRTLSAFMRAYAERVMSSRCTLTAVTHIDQLQKFTAALCTACMASAGMQQLSHALYSVVLQLPALIAQKSQRCCVEGSHTAFFVSAKEFM